MEGPLGLSRRCAPSCRPSHDTARRARTPIDRFYPVPGCARGPRTVARGGPRHADPPAVVRPDRAAADAGRGRGVRRRQASRRVREAGRSAARLAALRRADGDVLARPGALRRLHRLPQRQPDERLARTATTSSAPSTRNKPFDQFTVEQLAGDLLPERDDASRRWPRRYNRLLQTTEEGGAQAKEYEAKYAADRVRNVSSGLARRRRSGAAECHDHKFDPYTHEGLLPRRRVLRRRAGGGGRPSQKPGMPVPTPEQDAKLKRIDDSSRRSRNRWTGRRRSSPPSRQRTPSPARTAGHARATRPPGHRQREDRPARRPLPTMLVTNAGPPRDGARACRAATGWTTPATVVTPGVAGLPARPRRRGPARRRGSTWPSWTRLAATTR